MRRSHSRQTGPDQALALPSSQGCSSVSLLVTRWGRLRPAGDCLVAEASGDGEVEAKHTQREGLPVEEKGRGKHRGRTQSRSPDTSRRWKAPRRLRSGRWALGSGPLGSNRLTAMQRMPRSAGTRPGQSPLTRATSRLRMACFSLSRQLAWGWGCSPGVEPSP